MYLELEINFYFFAYKKDATGDFNARSENKHLYIRPKLHMYAKTLLD